MVRFSRVALPTATLALVILATSSASAHAFGTRYDLPITLGIFLSSAGAAVLLSFIVMARFFRHRDGMKRSIQFNISGLTGLRWISSPLLHNFLRSLSVALFVLVLAAR